MQFWNRKTFLWKAGLYVATIMKRRGMCTWFDGIFLHPQFYRARLDLPPLFKKEKNCCHRRKPHLSKKKKNPKQSFLQSLSFIYWLLKSAVSYVSNVSGINLSKTRTVTNSSCLLASLGNLSTSFLLLLLFCIFVAFVQPWLGISDTLNSGMLRACRFLSSPPACSYLPPSRAYFIP